jgi:predicted transcriptional regulator
LKEKRRRSAAVSRKLRILRAHGLIQKVPKTHRYHVTSHGRLAITAILTMDRTSIALLNKAAA